MIKKILNPTTLVVNILALIGLPLMLARSAQAVTQALPGVVISEVKLGGALSGQPTEFVELFNNSDQAIDFDSGDWWLEYAKPTAQISDCQNTSWSGADLTGNVKNTAVTGLIQPRGFIVVEISMNDNVGGAVRLQHSGQIDDEIGWGSPSSAAPCQRGTMAIIPANTKSLQRQFISAEIPAINNDNSLAFVAMSPPTPGAATPLQAEPDPDSDSDTNSDTQTCRQLRITEILPNPVGSDSGKEFIEIFNLTSQTVDLAGCSLRVGSAQLQLSGLLEPTSYRAFYGLTLPNSAGGTVDLLSDTEVIDSVTYPGDLHDNEAYGLIEDEWHRGLVATPDQKNTLSTSTPSKAGESAQCPPGKFRNPTTNRCRNIASTSSGLTPCKPGQQRNPATNRCRNIASASKQLAPCKEGQERNPETNRCRNVAAAKTSNKMNDPKSGPRPVSYYIFGVMAVLGVGYGIYEYRASIANLVKSLLNRKREA